MLQFHYVINALSILKKALSQDIEDRFPNASEFIHALNGEIEVEDIDNNYELLINPEFLICTSFNTHQSITFGNRNKLFRLPRERKRGDTTLW